MRARPRGCRAAARADTANDLLAGVFGSIGAGLMLIGWSRGRFGAARACPPGSYSSGTRTEDPRGRRMEGEFANKALGPRVPGKDQCV